MWVCSLGHVQYVPVYTRTVLLCTPWRASHGTHHATACLGCALRVATRSLWPRPSSRCLFASLTSLPCSLAHPMGSAFMGTRPTRAPAREARPRGISRGCGRSGSRVFCGGGRGNSSVNGRDARQVDAHQHIVNTTAYAGARGERATTSGWGVGDSLAAVYLSLQPPRSFDVRKLHNPQSVCGARLHSPTFSTMAGELGSLAAMSTVTVPRW